MFRKTYRTTFVTLVVSLIAGISSVQAYENYLDTETIIHPDKCEPFSSVLGGELDRHLRDSLGDPTLGVEISWSGDCQWGGAPHGHGTLTLTAVRYESFDVRQELWVVEYSPLTKLWMQNGSTVLTSDDGIQPFIEFTSANNECTDVYIRLKRGAIAFGNPDIGVKARNLILQHAMKYCDPYRLTQIRVNRVDSGTEFRVIEVHLESGEIKSVLLPHFQNLFYNNIRELKKFSSRKQFENPVFPYAFPAFLALIAFFAYKFGYRVGLGRFQSSENYEKVFQAARLHGIAFSAYFVMLLLSFFYLKYQWAHGDERFMFEEPFGTTIRTLIIYVTPVVLVVGFIFFIPGYILLAAYKELDGEIKHLLKKSKRTGKPIELKNLLQPGAHDRWWHTRAVPRLRQYQIERLRMTMEEYARVYRAAEEAARAKAAKDDAESDLG